MMGMRMRAMEGGTVVGVGMRVKGGLRGGAFKCGGEVEVLVVNVLIRGEVVKDLLVVYNKVT